MRGAPLFWSSSTLLLGGVASDGVWPAKRRDADMARGVDAPEGGLLRPSGVF